MKHLLIFSALLGFTLWSCDHLTRAPKFISSIGSFELFSKQITVNVFETQDNRINYTVRRRETNGVETVGPQAQPIAKDRPWFIYPASASEIWIYDGDKDVLLMEFSDKHTAVSDIASVPDLLQRAPPQFSNRLPADLKPK